MALLSLTAVPAHADGELKVSVRSADDSKAPASVIATFLGPDNRPLARVDPSEVRIEENGVAGRIVSVERTVDSNVGIGVIVTMDVSGSMVNSIQAARNAALAFVASLSPNDSAAVVSFANTVTLEQEITRDRAAVNAALNRLRAAGNTALFEAVSRSVDEASRSQLPHKVVILLSDGEDFGAVSQTTREAALEKAASSGVTFYIVGLGNALDQPFLTELARRTQGQLLIAPTAAEVTRAYGQLAELLRSQYIISFDPPPAEQRQRNLRIRIANQQGSGEGTLTYEAKRAAPPPAATPAPAVRDLPQPVQEPVRSVDEGGGGLPVALPLAGAALAAIVAAWLLWRPRRQKEPRAAPDPVRQNLRLSHSLQKRDVSGHAAILRMLTGPLSGEHYRVDGDVVTVGYARGCTVRLSSEDPRPPDEHVRIWWRDEKLMLHHVGRGRTTTLVSGRRVGWATLEAGDVIELGQHKMAVELE